MVKINPFFICQLNHNLQFQELVPSGHEVATLGDGDGVVADIDLLLAGLVLLVGSVAGHKTGPSEKLTFTR